MSSIKKFNAHKNIRIDRVKAHHTILRPKKKKGQARDDTDWEGDYENNMAQPWEIANVKNLCAGKPKKNLKRERIFDTMDDGKVLKIKIFFFLFFRNRREHLTKSCKIRAINWWHNSR